MMSADKREKYENYQFTKDERKDILDSLKEYFSLSRDERFERRNADFFNESHATKSWWFERWLPFMRRKIYDYMIKVESWPDEICDVDLEEMEQIYLDPNYYELMPFESSLTYTEKVMEEYLNNKSNRRENVKRSSCNKARSNVEEIKKKKSNNDFLRQRLVNQRIWLNEQAHLNERSNDRNNNLKNANCSNCINYINNDQEFDQEFEEEFDREFEEEFDQDRSTPIKNNRSSKRSTRINKSKNAKPSKSPKKTNRSIKKSVSFVQKAKKDDMETNFEFSDCENDDFETSKSNQKALKMKENYLELNSKGIYRIVFFLIVIIIIIKLLF